MKLIRLFIYCIILVPVLAGASDFAKEKRWAEQTVDAILDGEVVWLNTGGHKFLGIQTEAAENKQRTVIIMHGMGVHPDWQQVIQPLRIGLTEHNWTTLSIQMPVLGNEAEYHEYAPLFDEVAPRIDTAIEHLKKQGNKKIVLIAHSLGSAMSAYYLSQKHQPVDGFIAIGTPGSANDPRMNTLTSLSRIHNTPILDLYGSDDLKNIRASAPLRQDAAKKAGNHKYKQLKVTGANHFFDDQDEELIKAVSDWLNQLN